MDILAHESRLDLILRIGTEVEHSSWLQCEIANLRSIDGLSSDKIAAIITRSLADDIMSTLRARIQVALQDSTQTDYMPKPFEAPRHSLDRALSVSNGKPTKGLREMSPPIATRAAAVEGRKVYTASEAPPRPYFPTAEEVDDTALAELATIPEPPMPPLTSRSRPAARQIQELIGRIMTKHKIKELNLRDHSDYVDEAFDAIPEFAAMTTHARNRRIIDAVINREHGYHLENRGRKRVIVYTP